MNKLTGLMGAALLAGGVLAGCSADSENAVPNENAADEAVTPAETEESEGTDSSATEDQAAGEEATGTFNGLADAHTVEIEVDGQPTAYQFDPDGDIAKQFGELKEGDNVTFEYVQDGEQLVINELK